MEAPDIIGNAMVISYAVVNLYQPSKEFERNTIVYGFAICQYKGDKNYYLFSCNDQWVEFADTWHEDIEDAEDQAEFQYPGITNNWINK